MTGIGCPHCGRELKAPTVDDAVLAFRLTRTELLIFEVLFNRPGSIVAVETLIDQMYQLAPNGEPDWSDGIVKVMIHRIRKKLPANYKINTVWGNGYTLETVQ